MLINRDILQEWLKGKEITLREAHEICLILYNNGYFDFGDIIYSRVRGDKSHHIIRKFRKWVEYNKDNTL